MGQFLYTPGNVFEERWRVGEVESIGPKQSVIEIC